MNTLCSLSVASFGSGYHIKPVRCAFKTNDLYVQSMNSVYSVMMYFFAR